jgi:threonine dehydrogenase-like Zn-dependent dehydrogenase
MNIEDIRQILVVGTGTMGQMIALQCARHGYEVIAYDCSAESLENAKAKIPAYAAKLVAQQWMTPEESAAALADITSPFKVSLGVRPGTREQLCGRDMRFTLELGAWCRRLLGPRVVFSSLRRSTYFASMSKYPANCSVLACVKGAHSAWDTAIFSLALYRSLGTLMTRVISSSHYIFDIFTILSLRVLYCPEEVFLVLKEPRKNLS